MSYTKAIVDEIIDAFEEHSEYSVETGVHMIPDNVASFICYSFNEIAEAERKGAWDMLLEGLEERGIVWDGEEDVEGVH